MFGVNPERDYLFRRLALKVETVNGIGTRLMTHFHYGT